MKIVVVAIRHAAVALMNTIILGHILSSRNDAIPRVAIHNPFDIYRSIGMTGDDESLIKSFVEMMCVRPVREDEEENLTYLNFCWYLFLRAAVHLIAVAPITVVALVYRVSRYGCCPS